MGLPDTDALFPNILVDNILPGGDPARAQAYLQKCEGHGEVRLPSAAAGRPFGQTWFVVA